MLYKTQSGLIVKFADRKHKADTDSILIDSEYSESFLRYVIQSYLVNLQSGKLGVPGLTQLESAGILHSFLERSPYEK